MNYTLIRRKQYPIFRRGRSVVFHIIVLFMETSPCLAPATGLHSTPMCWCSLYTMESPFITTELLFFCQLQNVYFFSFSSIVNSYSSISYGDILGTYMPFIYMFKKQISIRLGCCSIVERIFKQFSLPENKTAGSKKRLNWNYRKNLPSFASLK